MRLARIREVRRGRHARRAAGLLPHPEKPRALLQAVSVTTLQSVKEVWAAGWPSPQARPSRAPCAPHTTLASTSAAMRYTPTTSIRADSGTRTGIHRTNDRSLSCFMTGTVLRTRVQHG